MQVRIIRNRSDWTRPAAHLVSTEDITIRRLADLKKVQASDGDYAIVFQKTSTTHFLHNGGWQVQHQVFGPRG